MEPLEPKPLDCEKAGLNDEFSAGGPMTPCCRTAIRIAGAIRGFPAENLVRKIKTLRRNGDKPRQIVPCRRFLCENWGRRMPIMPENQAERNTSATRRQFYPD